MIASLELDNLLPFVKPRASLIAVMVASLPVLTSLTFLIDG